MNKSIRPFDGHYPEVTESTYIADTAIVVGDVKIGSHSSIWFHSVLRGDINSIQIGDRTNLQDGTVVHVDYEINDVRIGDEVTIGHRAVIHGCTIESRCLIGMNATILSGAVIRIGAIVAAGALVRENQEIPERTLVAGVPAKEVRKITDEEWDMINNSAQHYVDYARFYQDEN